MLRTRGWTPNHTLLPVPVGREDEAREVLEFLTALADEGQPQRD